MKTMMALKENFRDIYTFIMGLESSIKNQGEERILVLGQTMHGSSTVFQYMHMHDSKMIERPLSYSDTEYSDSWYDSDEDEEHVQFFTQDNLASFDLDSDSDSELDNFDFEHKRAEHRRAFNEQMLRYLEEDAEPPDPFPHLHMGIDIADRRKAISKIWHDGYSKTLTPIVARAPDGQLWADCPALKIKAFDYAQREPFPFASLGVRFAAAFATQIKFVMPISSREFIPNCFSLDKDSDELKKKCFFDSFAMLFCNKEKVHSSILCIWTDLDGYLEKKAYLHRYGMDILPYQNTKDRLLILMADKMAWRQSPVSTTFMPLDDGQCRQKVNQLISELTPLDPDKDLNLNFEDKCRDDFEIRFEDYLENAILMLSLHSEKNDLFDNTLAICDIMSPGHRLEAHSPLLKASIDKFKALYCSERAAPSTKATLRFSSRKKEDIFEESMEYFHTLEDLNLKKFHFFHPSCLVIP